MEISEVEMGEHLVGWVSSKGWEVYQEVQFRWGSKVADVIAVNDQNEVWVIEIKTSLSLQVLEQAFSWNEVHYKSIAVPHSRRRSNFGYMVAKKFDLGVILVTPDYVEERVKPVRLEPDEKNVKTYRLDRLTELHKNYSKAGSKSGGYLTPYKYSIMEVKKYIEENPGCTIKQMVDSLGAMHWAHDKSAKNNLRVALQNWESTWCKSEGNHIDGKWQMQYWIKKEEGENV